MSNDNWSIAETFEKEYRTNTYAPVNVVRYYAMLVEDTDKRYLKKYGRMTKEEAIAMAKLLNASQTY